jgi:hypothetical protein
VLTWKGVAWPNERPPRGPIKGYHVAGGKCTRTAHERILKQKWLVDPPNLANHVNYSHIHISLEELLKIMLKLTEHIHII